MEVRDSLEQATESEELQLFPELSELCARVEVADARFRPMLIPDAFPRMNRALWWARGIVRYGRKRLVESLRREYGIEIDEMELPDNCGSEPVASLRVGLKTTSTQDREYLTGLIQESQR